MSLHSQLDVIFLNGWKNENFLPLTTMVSKFNLSVSKKNSNYREVLLDGILNVACLRTKF